MSLARPVARHAHGACAWRGARGADAVGEGPGRRGEVGHRPEAGDVDRQEQIGRAIGLGKIAIERPHRLADRARGEAAGQEIDHDGKAEALCSARRQQHAGDSRGRIGGRQPRGIRRPARLDRLAAAFGETDLAHRAGAEGEVEHDRRGRSGHGDGDGIVADHALGAARRRHQRPGIGHDDADAAGLGHGPGEPAGGAEMEGVAHGNRRETMSTGAFHGERGGADGGHVAEAVLGIEHDLRAGIRHDPSFGGRRDRSRADAIEIHGQQHQAM
ncbi:hypothetical protein BN1110_02496 [bacterium YEK0313]|nr:hypothetical protein BN1110_02496 [bacterium YEK0313]